MSKFHPKLVHTTTWGLHHFKQRKQAQNNLMMDFSTKFKLIIKDMAQFELKSSSYSLHTTTMVKNPNLAKVGPNQKFQAQKHHIPLLQHATSENFA